MDMRDTIGGLVAKLPFRPDIVEKTAGDGLDVIITISVDEDDEGALTLGALGLGRLDTLGRIGGLDTLGGLGRLGRLGGLDTLGGLGRLGGLETMIGGGELGGGEAKGDGGTLDVKTGFIGAAEEAEEVSICIFQKSFTYTPPLMPPKT
jgi:hypothetical protein